MYLSFSIILSCLEYESKDTYFFQLPNYLDQIINYFIPLSRILVDKSSLFFGGGDDVKDELW